MCLNSFKIHFRSSFSVATSERLSRGYRGTQEKMQVRCRNVESLETQNIIGTQGKAQTRLDSRVHSQLEEVDACSNMSILILRHIVDRQMFIFMEIPACTIKKINCCLSSVYLGDSVCHKATIRNKINEIILENCNGQLIPSGE